MANGVVYNGRDNIVPLLLTDNDVAHDLSNMTKCQISVAGQEFDSVINSELFDLGAVEDGIIGLKFGAAGIIPGQYKIGVVVFDTANENGIAWQHEDNLGAKQIKVLE